MWIKSNYQPTSCRNRLSECVMEPLGDNVYKKTFRLVGSDTILTREETTIDALNAAGVSITSLMLDPTNLMSPTNPLDVEEQAGSALTEYINSIETTPETNPNS